MRLRPRPVSDSPEIAQRILLSTPAPSATAHLSWRVAERSCFASTKDSTPVQSRNDRDAILKFRRSDCDEANRRRRKL